jgi:hypothetical protein
VGVEVELLKDEADLAAQLVEFALAPFHVVHLYAVHD